MPSAESSAVITRGRPGGERSLVARLLPSRPWRIALATIVVAIFFPPARLLLVIILGLSFFFVGPGLRWARKNRLVLVGLILIVPTLLTASYYLLEEAERIDFTALQPGTYVGTGVGKNAVEPLEVTATVGVGGTVALEVTAESESQGRPAVDEAIDELPGRIAAARSLDVDAVSGATYTSDGIKAAAYQALQRAGGAGEQPFYVKALQWLTYGEFSREMIFQLCIIYGIIFMLDFMISGVVIRNTGESLNCYNCQACVGVCPVGRVEDDVPLPMTMVLETRLGNYDRVEELAKYCVGCARCAARCPNGISALSAAGKAIAAKRSLFEV